MDAETEEVTVTVTMAFSKTGGESGFDRLWIGKEEVPIEGRSVSQCLEAITQQGWKLINSRATADFRGILCEYDFGRRVAQPQSNDTVSITPVWPPVIN